MVLLTRAMGVLSVLVLAGAVLMGVMGALQFNPTTLPPNETGGFSRPVMALEFVETTQQARVILDLNGSQNREALGKQIWVDFLWIACYWFLFLAVSYVLSLRNCPWAFYLSVVAAISATAAAVFDARENLGMLQVINNPAISQDALTALHIRDAALVKWTLIFVTLALLAPTFYGLDKQLHRIGFFFTITALAGLIGLWYKPLLGVLVPLPLLIGLLLLTYYSLRFPKLFLEKRC
ncbi:MAG: hypothetical protein AABN95_12080 [Acidobacteriota bacterium]